MQHKHQLQCPGCAALVLADAPDQVIAGCVFYAGRRLHIFGTRMGGRR